MSFARTLLALPLLAAAFASPGLAGDATKGAQVAKLCVACHSVTDAKNKVGPSLVGVVGRPIGSVADYNYSESLKEYGAKAGAWDEAKLDSYLENPKKDVPKGKMAFGGVKDAVKRADLIAYLATLK